jgi:hypothetical protein
MLVPTISVDPVASTFRQKPRGWTNVSGVWRQVGVVRGADWRRRDMPPRRDVVPGVVALDAVAIGQPDVEVTVHAVAAALEDLGRARVAQPYLGRLDLLAARTDALVDDAHAQAGEAQLGLAHEREQRRQIRCATGQGRHLCRPEGARPGCDLDLVHRRRL